MNKSYELPGTFLTSFLLHDVVSGFTNSFISDLRAVVHAFSHQHFPLVILI